jgi:IPT/TIG domain/FG-GAP repeat
VKSRRRSPQAGLAPRRSLLSATLLSLLAAAALSLGLGASEADIATARLAPATSSTVTESPEGKLMATAGEEIGNGLAGFSVAMSADGNTALVGAPADNGYAGAVWVFARSGSEWVQQGPKLMAGEGGAGGESCEETPSASGGEEGPECGFGRALAISADGNTVLVGAPRQDEQQGAAWVFTRSEGKWSRTSELTGAGETAEGRFGRAVALSGDGNTALVSAPGDQAGHGRAWVFARSGSSWSQQGESLAGAGEDGEGHFGASIALSVDGSTALIGAPGDNGFLGAAWVFTRSGETWSEDGSKLTGAGANGEAHFGYSVALSGGGTTALIGGRHQQEGAGAAWVFTSTAGEWSQQGSPLTGGDEAGEEFGYSVALASDGNTALIGAPHDNLNRGSAWLFERSGTSWGGVSRRFEGGSLETGKGSFGTSVSLSGDAKSALVGAETDHAKIGAAFIFGPSPSISGVSPGEGPAGGGTTVTISGANLSEASAVRFGESEAESFTVDSPSTITAISPPGKGVVHVTVESPYGTSLEGPVDRFHYLSPGGSSSVSSSSSSASSTTPTGSSGVLGFGASSGGGCGVVLLSKHLAVHVYKQAWAILRLRGTGLGRCAGKVRLRVKLQTGHGHTKLKTIGTAIYTVLAGHTLTVKVKLNATGAALLKKGGGHLNGSLLLVRSSPAPTLARTASVRLSRQKSIKTATPKK